MQNSINTKDVEKTFNFLNHEKESEIRLIDPHKKEQPKSIFCKNKEQFVKACEDNFGKYNIYVGINERKEGGKNKEDVTSVKTVVIDIDPERETNTASTEKELQQAKDLAFRIEQDFVDLGFIRPAKAMSGNGIQLWFAFPTIQLNEDNKIEIEGKVKRFIFNLQKKYNCKEAKIDQIGDLPRIIKVMGTKSIKGEDTLERPHRIAEWLYFNGRQEDTKFKEELLKLEPLTQTETIAAEGTEKKESRSEIEFGAVCQYINRGLSKEEIFSKMMAYAKWANPHHPNYREHTYNKALLKTKIDPTDICEVPTLDLIDFTLYEPIFKDTHKHLPAFELIHNELGLIGKEYYVVEKVLNYRIESLRQETVCTQIGKEWTDNRIHCLFIGSAGTGKGQIKRIVKMHSSAGEGSAKRVNIEQLIGKLDKKGNELPGYFRKKALELDESHTLISEEDANLAAIMREFRIAMDVYRQNTVEKKNVDAHKFLAFEPETRFGFYSHDTILPPTFFDLGTARRLFAFELKPIKVKEDAAIENLLKENYSKQLQEYINTCSSEFIPTFTKESIEEVIKWIKTWNKFCLLHPNQRIRAIGQRFFFSNKLYFLRLVTILALIRGEVTITKLTTKQACFDCVQFLLSTLNIYGNKSLITLSRDTWKTDDMKEAMLFEWMYYNKARSRDCSPVSIGQLQEQIQDIWGLASDRQAKSVYSKLKKQGLVHDYKGQHSSVAWLGFEPNLEEFVEFGDCVPVDLPQFLVDERELLLRGDRDE